MGNWKRKEINTGFTAGILLGAFCLACILYLLVLTEKRAEHSYYLDIYSVNESVQ